jgi:hypothetical protein
MSLNLGAADPNLAQMSFEDDFELWSTFLRTDLPENDDLADLVRTQRGCDDA